ncbi:MAG: hypothetical protein AAFP90_24000, partial [Planctomycetota bacterium]
MSTAGSTASVSSPTTAGRIDGRLHGRSFDSLLIYGTIIIAALPLAFLSPGWEPQLRLVLWLDLWLLGFHHVIATFTRLAFDRESLRENRKLLVELPIAVVIGTVALYALGGVLAIATVYLYWQWFHYMRQSYGIERAYRFKGRAAGANDVGDLNGYVIYATAIAAILWRSSTGAELFIGMPVFMVPVPTFVAASALIIAGCMFSWWFVRTAGLVIRGEASPEHFVFTLSHCVVFFMAYVYIENITHGWLVINIWHNAQYLLFVWFANNKKFG